jgi:endonuclease G
MAGSKCTISTRWVIWFLSAFTIHFATSANADYDPASQYALGNPSNAIADQAQQRNFLISRPQYALAYIRDYGEARWVSWHLNAADIGKSGRGKFQRDTTLPKGWYQVKVDETPRWSKETPVNYDRGHMCPSGDRSSDIENNQQVFLMSNLVPQTPDNNEGPWQALEAYGRNLAKSGDECYIVAGIRGVASRISQGMVAVPKYLWKIIVVLPDRPGDDVARVNAQTRVIAVEMPNVPGIRAADWRKYRVSVTAIENRTGLRFFNNVPAAVRKALKAKVDRVH